MHAENMMAEDLTEAPGARGGGNFRRESSARLGGLLNEEGEDVRRVPVIPPADPNAPRPATNDPAADPRRRTGAWRGEELSGEAKIQYDFALRTLDYKIQANMLGNDLIIFAGFIVAFCFFFLVGRDIPHNYYFSKSMKDPLLGSVLPYIKQDKTFTNGVTEAEEWNRFVLDVLGNQVIDPTYASGGHLFLGAIRFRTQRVRKNTCVVNPAVIPKTLPAPAQDCYGPWTEDNADTGKDNNPYNQVTRWQYQTCAQNGGSTTNGIIASYDCGGYTFTVPWWIQFNQQNGYTDFPSPPYPPFPSPVWSRLGRTEFENSFIIPALYNDPPFVDNLATRFVTYEYFNYHPTLRTFLSTKMFVEEAAGGYWVPQYQFRVFSIWTNASIGSLIYDIFILVFVLYFVAQFFADIVRYRRREKKLLGFFFDTWNIMEFANLIIFIIMFGFRFAWIYTCQHAAFNLETALYNPVYPVVLDNILEYYMMQVYLNSINTVLIFLKILKFFRLNDRLNLLTRTLSEAQDSIIGVLFIFLLVVTAFAMTGNGLFGLAIWKFRNVDSAFSTMLQMLIGQFDYYAMKSENRVLAGFFFWCYIILALFCLLNFLIGVLMETFMKISQTKAVLPLETVLARTVHDWIEMFKPRNIKMAIVNQCKGQSRNLLLQSAMEMLREYRLVVYPPDAADAEDDGRHMLTRAIFMEGISVEVIEKITPEYLEYVWDDLVYEWDQSKNAQEAILAHRNLEMTTRGVKQAIGPHLELMQNFPGRMADVEAKLERIAATLEVKHLNSK